MTETIFIRPAVAGAVIPDSAVGEPLPESGKAVPRTPHWLGLLARGDVEECDPAQPTEPTVPTKPKAASKPTASNPEEV